MLWTILMGALLVAATWFDWATTKRVFELGGREANPVSKWLFKLLGIKGKLIFDLVIALGSSTAVCFVAGWQVALVFMLVLTLIQFFAATHNKDVIERLERKL